MIKKNVKRKLINGSVVGVLIIVLISFSSIPATQSNLFGGTLNKDDRNRVSCPAENLGTYVVWDNQYPDGHNYIRCQRAGEVSYCDVADDFHTGQLWTITGAEWDAVDTLQYQWDGLCDFLIFEFTPEGPGDPVVELWDVPGTREFIYELPTEIWYRYTIDLQELEMEFDLPAGDYYLLLRPVTDGSVGRSNWLTSAGNPGSESEFYLRCEPFGYPNWTAGHEIFPGEYYEVNFRLLGTGEGIPELEVGDIRGGFGVKTSLKNIGDGAATNVYWSLAFDGGVVLYPPDGISSGVFSTMESGDEHSLKTLAFGVGGFIQPMNLTVSIRADHLLPLQETIPVKVFFILVLV